jgi:hypothetical protein
MSLFTGDILALAATDKAVFTAGADGSLRRWALGKLGELSEAEVRDKAHDGRITALAVAGSLLFSAGYDGDIKVSSSEGEGGGSSSKWGWVASWSQGAATAASTSNVLAVCIPGALVPDTCAVCALVCLCVLSCCASVGVGCVQPSAGDGGQGGSCRGACALTGHGANATQQQSSHTSQQHQQQPQWLASTLTPACRNSVHG